MGFELGPGVAVGEGTGSTVAVGVGVGLVVGAGVGVALGFGFAIATPLFQTSFFPLFTHVNFLPANVDVCPTFLQVAPALIAAIAFKGATRAKIRVRASKNFFMH